MSSLALGLALGLLPELCSNHLLLIQVNPIALAPIDNQSNTAKLTVFLQLAVRQRTKNVIVTRIVATAVSLKVP